DAGIVDTERCRKESVADDFVAEGGRCRSKCYGESRKTRAQGTERHENPRKMSKRECARRQIAASSHRQWRGARLRVGAGAEDREVGRLLAPDHRRRFTVGMRDSSERGRIDRSAGAGKA